MKKSSTILVVFLYIIALLPVYGGNAINVGTATATPTFECIGMELPFTGDDDRDAHCDIQFRKTGTTGWKDGLRMYTDYHTDRIGFRGSIVHLEPGTEYDIRLNYYDPDGGSGQKVISASTWSESFPQGNHVQVNSQNSTLEVQSGSPGAYRVYDGALCNAIVDVNNARYCVNIENKSYIILRHITFRESDEHAIRIKNSHHIIIEDCEILNWGRPGTYCATQPGAVQDAGVQIESGEQIIVQHNHIHDPRGNTCDWRTAHPKGPRGIFFRGPVRHSVFRYNRITGNPDHYYQDIITGGSQGPDGDVDIYGNEISNTWDDGIEIEGNNINIRVWNNVVYNSYKGLASDNNDNTYYGPVYIWRNIFTDLFLSPGNVQSSDAFKLENEVGKGGIYLFNNTILGNTNHSVPRRAITNGPIFNLIAFNNIFDVEDIAYKDNVQTGSFLDYNGYSHARDAKNAGIRSDWEENGLFEHRFEYNNPEGWIHFLKPGNTAIDAGIIINNFADKFAGMAPDLGACEEGSSFVHVGPRPRSDILNPLPTATLNSPDGDTIIYDGDSVIFTAGGGMIYEFFVNGVSVQGPGISTTYVTTSLSDGDLVSVTVTDDNGCSDTHAGITMTVREEPATVIQHTQSTNIKLKTYPNPFNSLISISLNISKNSMVSVNIYDLHGRLVNCLANGSFNSGKHILYWDGYDQKGNQVPGGTYLLELLAGDIKQTKQVNYME